MEQEIRFCTARDGVRIAYATSGNGPALVKAANWLTNLDYDWDSPVWRHWLGEMARRHTLIRYDERGCGLSDGEVEDFSFNAWVRDLETVVETVGLDRFALLGISQGGAVAIDYAVRHPEKVSHLVLYGAYALGRLRRQLSADEAEQHQALMTLARIGWGKENPAFRQVFSHLFMPEATPEQLRWLDELQRKSTSAENAVRFYEVFGNIDVLDLLPKVSVPTLVLHARDDAMVPLESGRQLAAAIPNARFVLLESKNHILLESEPAWPRFVQAVFGFLGTADTATPQDAFSKEPGTSGLEGHRLSNYRILEKLGTGGMGVVYKARDQRLGRAVALKFLPLSLSTDEEAKRRFLQEAKAASAVDHPNICPIYDIGETDDGQLFLVMPCYEGETLKQKIARGPLPLEQAIDYAAQAAEGLSRVHETGIVHRDIKPANVMVTEHGLVKLLDFGLAKVANVHLTKTGTILGTMAYMSPEQALGNDTDARTDLWSLGVIMYEMLTGEQPFQGDYEQVVAYAITQEEPTPLRTLREETPDALALVVERLLRKDPDERYGKAEEVLAEIR